MRQFSSYRLINLNVVTSSSSLDPISLFSRPEFFDRLVLCMKLCIEQLEI